jgi:hypothetical protein
MSPQQERITLGETVLSFFMGRRHTRAVSTVVRKQRLSEQAKLDIEKTRREMTGLEEDIAELEAELQAAVKEIRRKWADLLDDLTTEPSPTRRRSGWSRWPGCLPGWSCTKTEYIPAV